jgi:hypothetical protein
MATLGLLTQKVPIFTEKYTFTLLSRVNLKSNLKINTCIVLIGSKHMGNEVSLIILVLLQLFQDGGGGHLGFRKLLYRSILEPMCFP